MKLTKDQWRERGIFNPYEITAAGGKPLIWIEHSASKGGWMVHGVGFKTDPTSHWTNDGSKWFSAHRKDDKERMLLVAKDWCKAKFGVCDWERSVFQSWHPRGAIEKASMKSQIQREKTK